MPKTESRNEFFSTNIEVFLNIPKINISTDSSSRVLSRLLTLDGSKELREFLIDNDLILFPKKVYTITNSDEAYIKLVQGTRMSGIKLAVHSLYNQGEKEVVRHRNDSNLSNASDSSATFTPMWSDMLTDKFITAANSYNSTQEWSPITELLFFWNENNCSCKKIPQINPL